MPRQPNPSHRRAALTVPVALAVVLGLAFGFAPRPSAAQDHKKTAAANDAVDEVTAKALHAEGVKAGPEGDPNIFEPQPALMIWTLVVFLGLLVILRRFAWKPLVSALHQREEHMEHVLEETERARNESEQLLAEHRRRLAASEEQIRAMFDQAKKDAQTLAEEIIKKSEAEAEAQKQRATREIVAARDQALAEIWTKTADLAVSVAGKVLGKSVTGDEHRRLVEAAIAELPASPNGQAHASGGRTA
jgi:F-type H+-transporting ATPase subunit b